MLYYQLLAHGRWFSPGTPASSTTKTGRHDIVEILLKVALITTEKSNQIKSNQIKLYSQSGNRMRFIVIGYSHNTTKNNSFYLLLLLR
jgi:hypothetical protein